MEKTNNENIDNSIIFILNNKNKFIKEDNINNIFKKYNIDYKIKDINIYQRALTHKSYTLDNINNIPENNNYNNIIKNFNIKYSKYKQYVPIQKNSYERLEFLGDALIKPIITKYICDRFKNQNEGFLSEFRTKIESTECLSILFEKMDLIDFIMLSIDYEKVRLSKNIHEDCFEAFIGAMYIENENNIGYIYEIINNLIINLIENSIDIPELIKNNINYKKELNEYCHKKQFMLPHYYIANKHYDKDEQLIYKCTVRINDIESIGIGINKKAAEQESAKNILNIYKKIEQNLNVNNILHKDVNTYIID